MDKKLFELNENTTPADSKRLAFGDASSGAENITLANFYTRLMSKLGFLKVANYLNEYQGWPSAQASVHNSINVYSKGEVDSKDSLKANKSNVIEKDSTTPYTPTLGTHPVNKKYVDPLEGVKSVGDILDGGISIIVNFGETLTTSNYIPTITIFGDGGNESVCTYAIIQRTTTSMTIVFNEYFRAAQNLSFGWSIQGRYRS